jgi:phenylacetate-CoA ligase
VGYADALRRTVDAAERFARAPRAEQEHVQFESLARLAAHAHAASPFWHERLEASGWAPGRPFDRAAFERLPVLTRGELLERAGDIRARPVDPAWGKVITVSTSGSTGNPVEVDRIAQQALHYDSTTILNHLWQRRDLSLKLGALRNLKRTIRRDNWGPPTSHLYRTGPSIGFNSAGTTMRSEYAELQAEKPDYLITQPGRARGLAQVALERGGSPHRIRELITIGETVTEDLRAMVREGLGAQIKDVYSTRDCGYLALECRLHQRFHVLAHLVHVEVVDDQGRAVAPGAAGRVLISILHSLAMPVLRYDIGDVAVAGREGCDCGLTLPALESILGRNRNLARLPDGNLRYVQFPGKDFLKAGPVRDYRLIQRGPWLMEVQVECAAPLGEAGNAAITRLVQDAMGYAIGVSVLQVPRVEHTAASKREEFVRIE